MNNSWTGGQYSIFRILLGSYLLIHFCHLLPWAEELFSASGMLADGSESPLLYLFPNILALIDAPWFVIGFIGSAAIASIFLMIGYQDKKAALWIWYVLACLFGRNPLIANPSLPYVGWMLLAHLFIPSSPYGAVDARRRDNPAGSWKMPELIYLSAWIVLAVSYSYSGYTKLFSPSWVGGNNINYVLNNPLARDYFLREFLLWLPAIFLQILTWSVLYIELFFAPLALVARLRPILWLSMLIIQFGFAFLLNFFDLTMAMILFHILTFDPAWVKPLSATGKEILFYDGKCGLCHQTVRFLLAEDTKRVFRFSPLQGEFFKRALPENVRKNMPDSIVLMLDDNSFLTRSAAVIYLLNRLGGMWRVSGILLSLVPLSIRDWGYDLVGRVRLKLFLNPAESCPLVSLDLQKRFLK
jgi:predicted DCC family thiol-disulfide oxidoreductase YuxK